MIFDFITDKFKSAQPYHPVDKDIFKAYNRARPDGPKDLICDIWFGEPIKKLRGYIEHNDLNYGCQHCKYFVEKRKFTGLKPQSFDKYSDYKKHRYPRVMEFE